MATVRVYLRVGKTSRGYKCVATGKPNYSPIIQSGYNGEAYPTVAVALDLKIPDEEFTATRILLDKEIKRCIPAVEIEEVEQKEVSD